MTLTILLEVGSISRLLSGGVLSLSLSLSGALKKFYLAWWPRETGNRKRIEMLTQVHNPSLPTTGSAVVHCTLAAWHGKLNDVAVNFNPQSLNPATC